MTDKLQAIREKCIAVNPEANTLHIFYLRRGVENAWATHNMDEIRELTRRYG